MPWRTRYGDVFMSIILVSSLAIRLLVSQFNSRLTRTAQQLKSWRYTMLDSQHKSTYNEIHRKPYNNSVNCIL